MESTIAAALAAQPRPATALMVPMARAYLGVCALACGGGALLLAVTLGAQPGGRPLAAAFAGIGVAAAIARRFPRRWLRGALTVLLTGVTLAIAAASYRFGLGLGLAAPGLPTAELMVCMLCAAVGWRAGAVLAAITAACALALAWFGPAGAAAAAGDWQPLAAHLGARLITIAAGLACGVVISRLLAGHVRSAGEREERFRRLLGLAVDAYWEIDDRYRLQAGAGSLGTGEDGPLTAELGRGKVPWELPQFSCNPETLDALLADLGNRLPFRDQPVRWRNRHGRALDYRVSGEPRFDDRGVFTGYWGVARDVTAMQAAQKALAATETRYQELFTRIPTPLVLHRSGRILDANPAALALFGQPDLPALVGRDLLDFYEDGESRQRARERMVLLHGQPAGTALPVVDFRLALAERQVSVRATSVRVDAHGGPALLAIFVDDTERLAAETAVRQSEAMLAHLVATSPDLISLTDLQTGRFTMVNRAFERIIGWSAAEAVGRTSLELGTWTDIRARVDFLRRLEASGTVTGLPLQFVTRSGAPVSMIVSGVRFVMDRHDYLVINARDVTESERLRLEREAILFNASVGIAVTRDQHFVLANHHFEQIYGWDSGELLGQPGVVVWGSSDDYAELVAVAGPLLARGEAFELERPGRRKDGSTFVARVRGRAVDPAAPVDSGTVWIVEDVTERRQAELALARARDEAESANRAKSAFLANTSHELRTPLNALLGLAQLAQERSLGEERRRQYLDQIAQSALTLAGIVSDILDLSKIEAGKMTLERLPFDLAAELCTLQQTYAGQAEQSGLALRLEIAADAHGLVLGDALRVRQVMANLLSNALKFTTEGEVVVAAWRPVGAGHPLLRLEVRDSGPGIAAEVLARLFKPFTQADQSTTRRYGGTGLGLSICHELATLMGGRVGAESHPGRGSTFWAELPLPPTRAQPPAPPPQAADDSLEGLRVLMVEDNAVNMMIACAMLERWGVEVTQAEDGEQAVAAVRRAGVARRFDAVLMDVHMPVMNGHQATRGIRAFERETQPGTALPIIALTAAALVGERDEALHAGMNDFLTKPIDSERLRATLRRWCLPAAAA